MQFILISTLISISKFKSATLHRGKWSLPGTMFVPAPFPKDNAAVPPEPAVQVPLASGLPFCGCGRPDFFMIQLVFFTVYDLRLCIQCEDSYIRNITLFFHMSDELLFKYFFQLISYRGKLCQNP